MCADDKNPGRFYCNCKVQKQHSHKEAPSVRPIISGSGSITEGIATFVEHHIQPISTSHDTLEIKGGKRAISTDPAVVNSDDETSSSSEHGKQNNTNEASCPAL